MLVSIVSILAAASAVTAQSSTVTPAPEVTGNPIGARYVGTLPPKAGSSLAGSIEGITAPDGKGVKFAVSFSGLPEEGGPFMYHIHEKPVPADGNCTGTGAHLDPYKRGEVPICDASKPETCQTGDLSGKFGNMTSGAFSAEYTDLYSATLPSDPAFFGDLSFVVHLSNKTRIGCANFTLVAGGEAPPSGSGYPTMPPTTASSGFAHPSDMPNYNSSMTAIPTSATTGVPIVPTSATGSPLPEISNAAGKVAGSAGLLLAAAAALVL